LYIHVHRPWHIIQRGNNRSACLYSDEDYHRYLDTLKEQAEKFDCVIHAYCLMTNHVHLFLTPKYENSAASLMKHLGQRYVQYINRTYQRSGTLWEGCFKSCLTQSEEYVLACYRYIELNPVRAFMVEHPAEYRWSSYRRNGQGEVDPLITAHEEYLRLGLNGQERQRHYRELLQAQIEPHLLEEIRSSTNGNYALGNERFREEIAQMLDRRVMPGKAGRPVKEY
jgi:putative transposase